MTSIKRLLDGKTFRSQKQYQKIITGLLSSIKKSAIPKRANPIYSKEIVPITKGKPLTEATAWGGVTMKNVDVEKNYIRKLLIINRLGVLGFECHKLKVEKLRVIEGRCVMLYSNHKAKNWKKGQVSFRVSGPGDRFRFSPGDEHGMIALTNCVIEETSTNHLDDLTYIYKL